MRATSDKNLATPSACPIEHRHRARIKKLGVICFVFFLLKGLLWLVLPVMIYLFNTW